MAILFYEDFEDALDFVNDWSQGTSHGSHELSTEQVRCGSKSYKVSVTSQGQEYRKEGMVPIKFIGSDFHCTIGNEYWIGFSLFLHNSYETPSDDGGILHFQAHGEPDHPPTCDPDEPWRNPPLHIGTADGKWQASSKWDSPQCSDPPNYTGTYWLTQDTFSTGEWHDFVINVKWSYGAGGFLKIWRDGVKIIDRTGGNCFNDDEGPYLWIGIYSYHIDNGQTITVYWDEFRIGDSNSFYSEVAPGGDSSSSSSSSSESVSSSSSSESFSSSSSSSESVSSSSSSSESTSSSSSSESVSSSSSSSESVSSSSSSESVSSSSSSESVSSSSSSSCMKKIIISFTSKKPIITIKESKKPIITIKKGCC